MVLSLWIISGWAERSWWTDCLALEAAREFRRGHPVPWSLGLLPHGNPPSRGDTPYQLQWHCSNTCPVGILSVLAFITCAGRLVASIAFRLHMVFAFFTQGFVGHDFRLPHTNGLLKVFRGLKTRWFLISFATVVASLPMVRAISALVALFSIPACMILRSSKVKWVPSCCCFLFIIFPLLCGGTGMIMNCGA